MYTLFRQLLSPVRRLTLLYTGALSLIALFSIIGQILVQVASQQALNETPVVNMANQQRMFSQKISKDALAIEVAMLTTDTSSKQYFTVDLRSTVAQWQQVHTALQKGDIRTGTPEKNSSEVTHLFTTLHPYYRAIFNASTSLLASMNAPTPPSRTMIITSVHSILTEEPTYLTIMNTIVLQYQHESEQRIGHLKNTENVLLLIMLGVLLCEGLLMFRPSIRSVHLALTEQTEAGQ